VPGVEVTAVATRNVERAERTLRELGIEAAVVPIPALAEHADVVVECAPSALLCEIAEPVLRRGKEVVVLGVGALLRHPELLELAEAHGGRLTVPTGALLGLDAVGAAAEDEIRSVTMTTRKPPRGLAGAPYLDRAGIDVSSVTEPTRVFRGTAREAAEGFPANVNVAAALALAGIGPDRTTVEIWADPTISRNTHTIDVSSTAADFTMTIANVPTDNPPTGRITALSVVSLLRKRTATLRVGS
jgi:aspartate dehydrogenase